MTTDPMTRCSSLSSTTRPVSRRTIAAATIGNALEWFDFVLFALLAVPISMAFFPSGEGSAGLLLALASYGVGFLARPVGSLVIGRYADRAGRKAALLLVIVLMAIGTAVIAVTPGYATIGVAAPLMIAAARLLQGFALGGEIGSSVSFLMEASPPHRRNLYTSLQMAGQFGATVAAATTAAATAYFLSADDFTAWGWRIPFFIGLLVVPVGLWLRFGTSEPETPRSNVVDAPRPGTAAGIFAACGMIAVGTAGVYVLIDYMPTYAATRLDLSGAGPQAATIVASALAAVTCPLAGALADRIGGRKMMLTSAAVLGLSVWPLFAMLTASPTLPTLFAVQACLALMLAVYVAPAGAMLARLFPRHRRSTGIGVGYSLGTIAFGGFGPFVVTWLIEASGNVLMPAFYAAAAAVISIVTLVSVAPAKASIADGMEEKSVSA